MSAEMDAVTKNQKSQSSSNYTVDYSTFQKVLERITELSESNHRLQSKNARLQEELKVSQEQKAKYKSNTLQLKNELCNKTRSMWREMNTILSPYFTKTQIDAFLNPNMSKIHQWEEEDISKALVYFFVYFLSRILPWILL